MNSEKKVSNIRAIIEAQENDLCPYCFEPFEVINKQEICYNHEEGDFILSMDDYYLSIVSVIKFGSMKKPTKYKNITEF